MSYIIEMLLTFLPRTKQTIFVPQQQNHHQYKEVQQIQSCLDYHLHKQQLLGC